VQRRNCSGRKMKHEDLQSVNKTSYPLLVTPSDEANRNYFSPPISKSKPSVGNFGVPILN
jgi:hypothetical protein